MCNTNSFSLRELERNLFKYEWQPCLTELKERFVRDGVVNPDTWNSNLPARILVVLKDPNGYVYWETKEWLEKEDFHKEKSHWKTWRLLAKCIHAIHCYKKDGLIKDYKKVQYAVSSPNAQYHQIQKIVLVNLKKQEGGSNISDEKLLEYFEKYNKEYFIKQIRLYDNIDYILCGGDVVFDILTMNKAKTLSEIYGKEVKVFASPRCAVIKDGPIILGCDHPAIRYSHEEYYDRLVKTLLFAEQHK